MKAFLARLRQLASLCRELCTLPVARLHFDLSAYPEQRHIYARFTKRHPRFKVVRNKTLGIALVDLKRFASMADYLHEMRFKGYAAPHRKRALALGYRVREIDRNDYADDIFAIHTSTPVRQGRPMDPAYLEKVERFDEPPYFVTYGVFNADNALVAYCVVANYGNFAATDRLLGYKSGHGIMYLLLADIIGRLIEQRQFDFFMYDTFLGAKPGLRDFKRRTGFRPYRARYSAA